MQSTDDDESDGDLNQRHMSASDARVRRDVSLTGDTDWSFFVPIFVYPLLCTNSDESFKKRLENCANIQPS